MTVIDLATKKTQLAFKDLLDVYIQDPVNNCGYLVMAENLINKYISEENSCQKTNNYINFVIPGKDSLIAATPILEQSPQENADIRIFDLTSKIVFIIPYNELNNYKVSLEAFNPHGISFVMPIKSDLIEELPALMRGLLQTAEFHPIHAVRIDALPKASNE